MAQAAASLAVARALSSGVGWSNTGRCPPFARQVHGVLPMKWNPLHNDRWLLVVFLALVSGCGGDESSPWPLAIAPSEQIEQQLRESYARLSGPDTGEAAIVADLQAADAVTQDLYDPGTRTAACEELYGRWSRVPTSPLWSEVAVRRARRVACADSLFAIFDSPACTDTTTAIGAYMRAWQPPTVANLVHYFQLAHELPRPPDAFFSFWIEFRFAYAARLARSPELAIDRCLALMPEARKLGGRKLESLLWTEIARASVGRGELDDALHAVVIADTLATIAMPKNGALVGVLTIRRLRADILAARRDVTEAFALYEVNVRDANRLGLNFIAGNNFNRAGALAEATGKTRLALEFDRRGLALALADLDSFSAPAHMMNIGRGFRLMGELDSCLVYQTRAERWVEAYPDPENVARLPLMQAEYYAQIGAYDVVDSLLEAAAQLQEAHDTVEARAEFHLELIHGWMEVGRPELVYRSIEEISDLRSGIGDMYADRHVVADLNLRVGEFLTRRGEYALAAESLDLAGAALATRSNPEKEWVLSRDRGLLDRARDNPRGAEKWFLDCIHISEKLGYPDRSATARLLLGAVRLDMGDFEGARESFPDEELESSFSTRVLALLLTGVSYLREGNPVVALEYLDEARDACRSWTPLDLIGRVELETGRAHALAGDAATALQYFEAVASRIRDADFLSGDTEELAYFTGDLRRDLVEAHLGVEPVDARESLEFAMELLPRWKPVDGELIAPQVIYFVGEDLTGRWIAVSDGLDFARLPGSSELVALLTPVRADMSVPGRAINANDVTRLSSTLLGAVGESWQAAETLHIVPDLALFGIPWAALTLPGNGQMLVQHGPLVILDRPSGEAVPARSMGDHLLVIAADGGGSAGLKRLRHAEDEGGEVAAAWATGEVDLRFGAAASSVLVPGSDLSSYRAIHVASHALVYSGRAEQTTLLLADEGESSTTVSRIRDLEISAELVFLSACEAGDGGETKSAHAGLARSFQDAGARQVIAPISVIDDQAARRIAVGFYENWRRGVTVAEALRVAQLAQLESESGHPFYWAFYQVFGGNVQTDPER